MRRGIDGRAILSYDNVEASTDLPFMAIDLWRHEQSVAIILLFKHNVYLSSSKPCDFYKLFDFACWRRVPSAPIQYRRAACASLPPCRPTRVAHGRACGVVHHQPPELTILTTELLTLFWHCCSERTTVAHRTRSWDPGLGGMTLSGLGSQEVPFRLLNRRSGSVIV